MLILRLLLFPQQQELVAKQRDTVIYASGEKQSLTHDCIFQSQ